MVQSGHVLTLGMAAGEPREFLSGLHTVAQRVKDVTITNCLPTVMAPYLTEFERYDAFRVESWFMSPLLRKLHATGRVSFIPNNLRFAGQKRNAAIHTDILLASASMPQPDGKIYLASGNVFEAETAKTAGTVILEISPKLPRLTGDCYIEWDDVDHLILADYELPTLPDAEPDDKDRLIGKQIAELVNDGDCIQVGIGGIPNALCAYLADKRDLGVHTEMMTTGIMRLMKSGAVNNSKKQVNIGKSVFCFAFGTSELYHFMDGNPDLMCNPGAVVNDPYVIAKNDNQVSINTTIEIDLTGQCCSESIGHVQFSGTGGQSDTAVGAQMSKNGRSIIALYSTTKNDSVSKIVPTLKPGAAVSLSRNDVDFVVTEYGVVRLRGLSIAQRAKMLISIAHPKFHDELLGAAHELGFTGPDWS